ncbi:MAG: hypothetical protein IJ294_04555 [Clostridia bacterium]|nr:hypothetical protein [Clostridia bacterium]
MRLIILGAGGYGRNIADLAEQSGRYDKICFLDDFDANAAGKCAEFPCFSDENTEFYAAFGNNALRMGWLKQFDECGCAVATIIHPTAYVSPKATVGRGVAILPKAIVNTGTVVGDGCIINCGCIVDHDCVLNEGVHVCPGAVIKAENRIPALEKIESGQVIANRTYPL